MPAPRDTQRAGTRRQTASKATPATIAKLTTQLVLALVALLVMGVTGYGWAVTQGMTSGFAVTDVLGSGSGGDKPLDGSRDILIVGMDSRTDVNGNPLSREQRNLVRAGSDQNVTNTDTLILMHVPNDGSKAVGISLPRDSYVEVPGHGKHKINSAFTRAKVESKQQLQAEGVTDHKEIEKRSNAAGAKLLIATVEQLTGRKVDNYASVNLLGFYDITKAVGGVDVCLKNAVKDKLSYANFKAGPQTVEGTSALAFVRQRHGLPRGDIDRVRRQQVFMTSMVRKILSAGTLGNPGKLNDLIGAIKKSVVLNSGWDLMGFAQQMSGLTGDQFKVQTIPVGSLNLQTPEDGVAVDVDPPKVRKFIDGFSGEASETAENDANSQGVTVNILNAGKHRGLAAKVERGLTDKGFDKGRVDSADARPDTIVRHAPGDEAAAQKVADALAVDATLQPDSEHTSGEVSVFLGNDYPKDGKTKKPSKASKTSAAPSSSSETPEPEEPLTAGTDVPCIN